MIGLVRGGWAKWSSSKDRAERRRPHSRSQPPAHPPCFFPHVLPPSRERTRMRTCKCKCSETHARTSTSQCLRTHSAHSVPFSPPLPNRVPDAGPSPGPPALIYTNFTTSLHRPLCTDHPLTPCPAGLDRLPEGAVGCSGRCAQAAEGYHERIGCRGARAGSSHVGRAGSRGREA